MKLIQFTEEELLLLINESVQKQTHEIPWTNKLSLDEILKHLGYKREKTTKL
jgi:hypothetical protein